jgi:hypothetical protein
VLAVTGALMVLLFLSQTIIAVAQRSTRGAKSNLVALSMIPTDWRPWLAAAETAAWRLKWVMIPLTLLVLFGSRKLYRSVQQSPERFCGFSYARRGYLASAVVPLLVLLFIGITVPGRLQHRQWSIEAGHKAQAYRIDRALIEYREMFGTLPSELKDLSKSLPDADGSLAAALKDMDALGYTANSEVAAVPKQKPRPLRGAVILNASIGSAPDEALSGGISFTNYELRLPGADKLLNTEDDLIVIDGVTYKPSELPRRGAGTSGTAPVRKPRETR